MGYNEYNKKERAPRDGVKVNNMRVQVTKKMAAYINKKMREAGGDYCIEAIELHKIYEDNAAWYIGRDNLSVCDYDVDNEGRGFYKVIVVFYKGDCYASNTYITTRMLNKYFRDGGRNEAGFIQELKNTIFI